MPHPDSPTSSRAELSRQAEPKGNTACGVVPLVLAGRKSRPCPATASGFGQWRPYALIRSGYPIPSLFRRSCYLATAGPSSRCRCSAPPVGPVRPSRTGAGGNYPARVPALTITISVSPAVKWSVACCNFDGLCGNAVDAVQRACVVVGQCRQPRRVDAGVGDWRVGRSGLGVGEELLAGERDC